MAMGTPEIKRLIASVKAAIPDLEAIVTAREAGEQARDQLAGLQAELASLAVKRDSLKGAVEAESKAVEQGIEKAKGLQAQAEKTYHSRIEDLQRKVTSLDAKAAAGAQKLEEQRRGHAIAEANHENVVKEIESRARAAEKRLEDAQARIRGLHADVAGLIQAP